jgi:Zn finger protein HypA/HybF involved in hydrogenase expression
LSVLQANCPSCAAPIEFKSGSTIVLVCPFCRSAVARTDKNLEDLGKVADIVESESPLKIGLKGTFKGNRFELTGRAQLKHELGGFWDEWYATFSNGWVGWLAEAQGKFYLTFYQPLPANAPIPTFGNLQVGQTVSEIPNTVPLVVTEKGTATSIAADGEIPYKLVPNERSDYADLSGAGNAFGTIDYSMSPPWVFVGQQVSLAEIGLADAKSATRKARRVAVGAMGCPNCGGSLELNAPDKTERVTCPFCHSLLDVNQGNLTFLRSLAKMEYPFVFLIGAEGTIAGDVKFKIIGAIIRSVSIEGETYLWDEYLLYNPQIGFRWLVYSDNHWNFVEPINAAEVIVNGNIVSYNGSTFKIFQDAPARVEYVQGEFYWRVEQGETVRAVDYVAPPLMLSQEITSNEINWSLGTYLTNAEVERAFGISDLPKPFSVAPNQPFTDGFYIKWGFALLGLLCLIAILMIPLGGLSNNVLSQQIILPPMTNATAPQTIFSQPFDLKGNRNVKITASAPVNNSFADLDIDLINEQNNEVESVNVPIEYYAGVDEGESWSEGGQTQDATISSLPAGKYSLRVEGTWQNFGQPLPVDVRVEQNVWRGVNFWLSFFLLALLPVWALIRKFIFESKRWSESMLSGSSSSGGDE